VFIAIMSAGSKQFVIRGKEIYIESCRCESFKTYIKVNFVLSRTVVLALRSTFTLLHNTYIKTMCFVHMTTYYVRNCSDCWGCYVCGIIIVIRHVGVDMLRVSYIIIVIRVGVDMLRVWYSYCDTTCWGGHVTCVVYNYCDTTCWGGHVTCVV
jgi:hypothetical protein